jgi:hypothetical protein
MPDVNEPPAARLDDVIDTEERFDVAGFGELTAVTTYLTASLIGRRVRINNSVWEGYTDGSTLCEIVGYVAELGWHTGAAPALILIAEGDYYAFKPNDVWRALSAASASLAKQELAILASRAS